MRLHFLYFFFPNPFWTNINTHTHSMPLPFSIIVVVPFGGSSMITSLSLSL
eukprot:c47249_g1_i1 orf=3-152(-)